MTEPTRVRTIVGSDSGQGAGLHVLDTGLPDDRPHER